MTPTTTIYRPDGLELVTVTHSTDSYRRVQVMGENSVTLKFALPQYGVSDSGISNLSYSGDTWSDSSGWKRSIAVGDNGMTKQRLTFTTSRANVAVNFEIYSSSETNYDFMLVGLPNDPNLSRTANYTDRVSGNGVSKMVSVTFPTAGTNYIEFAYAKDGSYVLGGDYGMYRVTSGASQGTPEIPIGSYIYFKGQRYTLYNPSNFKKNGIRDFEYTLKLEAYQAMIVDSIFINIPDGRTTFSRTARPQEFLQSLVDNLNREDVGWTVGAYIEVVPTTIAFNETPCSEALRLMAEAFKTEWEVNGKEISLRKVEYFKDAPLELQYGQGNGFLPAVGRSNFDNSRPINRLFIRGGERNIDYSVYGSQTLLLPSGQSISYDGTYFQDEAGFNSAIARTYTASSDGRSLTRTGAPAKSKREGSMDLTGIYPMREGVVTRVLWYYKDVEYTTYSTALAAARADGSDGGSVFCDIFDNTIPASLDYSVARLDGEQMIVVFQTGILSGREIGVLQDENSVTGYVHVDPSDPTKNRRFKLITEFTDGFPMPGGNFSPAVGDKYSVFGMKMPDSYVRDDATKSGASWDLFREAIRYKYENEDYRFTFTGELNGIWAQANWDTIEDKIVAGGYVQFSDPQFQPEGVLIRISAIKEFLHQPYKPTLELTNVVIGGGLRGELAEIPQQEVVIDDQAREIRRLKSRRWADTNETKASIDEMYAAMGGALSASSLSTMYVRVGNEMGQFRFVTSLTSNTIAQGAPTITYDAVNNRVRISGRTTGSTAYIQHQTLGIDVLDGKSSTGGNGTSVRPSSEYKSWSIPSMLSGTLESDKLYWIYARVSKIDKTGVFLVETAARTEFEDADYYYLVVGSLNSERDGERSFFPLYGFAELGPGQLTIGLIRSSGGNTWINLDTGDLHVGNNATYIDWNAVQGALTLYNAALFIGGEDGAKIELRPDGSGLLASGKILWDADGHLYLDTAIIRNSQLTDVEVSGILHGVTGSFKSLNCIDENGNVVGGISFGESGSISFRGTSWFEGDLYHQGAKDNRGLRFYSSDIWCRGSFGARVRNAMVIYGAYAYYYLNGLSDSTNRVYVSLNTLTGASNTTYIIPLYGSTGDASGFPVDLVIFNTASTYRYVFSAGVGKTVKVVNGYDNNNNIYVYTNGFAMQIAGGVAAEFINIQGFLNPAVSSNDYPGAGWLQLSSFDNNWG